MRELRDELISLNVDMSKLDKIMENIEIKEIYKVYIFYQFFKWEGTIEEERFVFYTEDEALAKAYYSLLQEVENAFDSSYGEVSADFYTAKLEKIQVQNYALERCPFCGEPVDRSKGWYCPNCGST